MISPLSAISVQSKFEEIRKSNQAAAQRLVESHYSSSSSDDDDNDVDHVKDGKKGKILASTFTTYTDQMGEEHLQLLEMEWDSLSKTEVVKIVFVFVCFFQVVM